jgi:hypothetical protein
MVRSNLISRWRKLGRQRQWLLIEGLAAVAGASAAIRLGPFKRAIQLGSLQLSGPSPAGAGQIITDVRWAVETAARNVPWRAMCIQQGLALQWMLRRRGIDARLHYGIARDEAGELEAHVWVAAGDAVVIGGAEAPRFRRVATFP